MQHIQYSDLCNNRGDKVRIRTGENQIQSRRKMRSKKRPSKREKGRWKKKGQGFSNLSIVVLCCLHGNPTKAHGWPLMANCILHSSFVNCCLPSSHFLLGHSTKPRTGGIRNGTSAQLSLPLFFFSFLSFFSLSLPVPRAAPPFISSPSVFFWPCHNLLPLFSRFFILCLLVLFFTHIL